MAQVLQACQGNIEQLGLAGVDALVLTSVTRDFACGPRDGRGLRAASSVGCEHGLRAGNSAPNTRGFSRCFYDQAVSLPSLTAL